MPARPPRRARRRRRRLPVPRVRRGPLDHRRGARRRRRGARPTDLVSRAVSSGDVTVTRSRDRVHKLGAPVTPATSPRPAPRRPASRQTYVVRRIGAGVVAVVVAAARRVRRRQGRRRPRRRGRRRRRSRRRRRRDRRRRIAVADGRRPPSPRRSPTTAPTRPTRPRRPSAPPPSGAAPASVLVVGDSDAAAFAPFLKDQLDATGVAATTVDYKVSSGLARPDFFDWPAHLRGDAAGGRPGHRRGHVRRQRRPGPVQRRRVEPDGVERPGRPPRRRGCPSTRGAPAR